MPKLKKRSQEQRNKSIRIAHTENQRKAREDKERRDREQLLNTEAHRRAREDKDRREREQLLDTEARKKARVDKERRDKEQAIDTVAHRKYRQDDERRKLEQSRNNEARQTRKLNPTVDEAEFYKQIKIGPTSPCQCCDGLFFVTNMKILHRKKILEKVSPKFYEQVLRPHTADGQEYLCSTCYTHINNKKVPKLCFSNGFSFPPIPEVLQCLTPLEERLVAGRIPFMMIQKLGVDRQCGLKGNVINIINPINETATILPRSFNEASVIQLMLMRKMEYKNPYMFETIRPKKVYDAAQYLASTELYKEEGIVLSDEWLKNMNSDVVDFVVDEGDKNMQAEANVEGIINDAEGGLNPGGQETLLIDFDSAENNEAIKFAPGEGQRPISLLMDANAEALSFPSIYCGRSRLMKDTKITRTQIAKSDARNKDRRCAIPSKLLYSYKLVQTYQIASQISLCLRKKKGSGKATAGNLLNEEFVDNLVQHDDGYKLLKHIRSSPSYWQDREKVLMTMLRQLGIATIFMTLSAAEVKWNELIVILMEVLKNVTITEEQAENMTWEDKADLIRRDPITCSRYFDHRFRQCQKFIILSKSGIFKDHPVLDFFTRIEFQHRGSPHMHGLFWLKDAPKFDEEDPESFQNCADFIDKYISCKSGVEGVIHQSHKHTRCCEVKYKGTIKCRFGMPYPPMDKTQILLPFPVDFPASVKSKSMKNLGAIKHQVEYLHKEKVDLSHDEFLEYMGLDEHEYIMAVRSGIHRPTVFLKRNIPDAFFNAYNTELAQSWKANMDIQFILDPYACCKYVAAYVSKSQRGMSELMNQVVEEVKSGGLSSKEKLKRFAHVFLNGSEVSAQEAAYSVLGIPLSRCSRDSVYINTSRPSERVFITRPAAELQELAEDSTDVVIKGLLHHYSQRPEELENCALAQFAAWWTYSKKESKKKTKKQNDNEDKEEDEEDFFPNEDEVEDDNENIEETFSYKLLDSSGFIKKRNKARVIRFRNFGRVTEEVEFCRENLMLYHPWRDEETDLLDKDFVKEYAEKEHLIEAIKAEFDTRLDINAMRKDVEQDLLEEPEENYLVDDEFQVMQGDDVEGDFGLEMGDETRKKAEKLKMPGMIDDEEYTILISKLNEKQLKYHNHITTHLSKKNYQAIYEFVSGGAGVGKSMLIKAICQTLMRNSAKIPGKDPTRIKVLLCASTGVAAFNIGGHTLHQAFGLPFNQYNGSLPRLTESVRNKFASQFADLDLIIIDEISMTSMEHLFQIDDRLRQIFKNPADFGGKSIVAVGDFNQLQPVMASWIFADPSKDKQILGYNYLWPKFRIFELTECMRQKGDIPFAEALNRLAVGLCTEEDVALFKTREMTPNNLTPPSSAIRLKFTNPDVDTWNIKSLAQMTTEGAISHANDRVQGTGKREHHEAIRSAAKNKPFKETQGLTLNLNLKIGAKYMMTLNVDTSDGLVNGAIGMLRKIIYGTTSDGRKIPLKVLVEFAHKEVGQKLKTRIKKIRSKSNVDEQWNWVPIGKENRMIHNWPGRKLEVVRSQFALIPAEAITFHKSQGSTFKDVVISMQYFTKFGALRNIPRRALYVGFSRSTSLKGLYIDGFFHPPDPPEPNDKVMLAMEELRKRPVLFEEDDTQNDVTKLETTRNPIKNSRVRRSNVSNTVYPIRTISKINVFPVDLASFSIGEWLTDSAVDLSLELVRLRNVETKSISVTNFGTFFLQHLSGHNWVEKNWEVETAATLMVFPRCRSGHWTVIVADRRTMLVTLYDSMNLFREQENLDQIVDFLHSIDDNCGRAGGDQWRNDDLSPLPNHIMQKNGSDCGVYVCMFVEYLARSSKFDFTESDMPRFRKLLSTAILNGRL